MSAQEPQWLQSALFLRAGFPVHGFTTRFGGVSEGPFASWNFSTSTGDSSEAVEQNYRILAQALELPREALHSVHQVHSSLAVHLETPEQVTHSVKADALLTGLQDQIVAVKTADCVPILLVEPQSQWVAAIHAGWRGVADLIVPQTIARLREAVPNARPLAAIGPHICHKCFQVGPEVAAQFPRHHRPDPSCDGRFLVHLEQTLCEQLLQAGLAEAEIDCLGACTICDPQQRFFSHRASQGACGRMLNFIAIPSTSL